MREGEVPGVTDIRPCELERRFGAVADQLPVERGDVYRFDAAGVPAAPPRLSTPAIRVRLGYSGSFVQRPRLRDARSPIHRGDQACVPAVGILILAGLFHAADEPTVVHLNHSDSAIRDIRVGGRPLIARDPRGYVTSPHSFEYSPGDSQRYPWPGAIDEAPTDVEAAAFEQIFVDGVRWEADIQEQLSQANAVPFVPDAHDLRPFKVHTSAGEPEAGEVSISARGVGRSSLDVTLWLPGSIGYNGPELPV